MSLLVDPLPGAQSSAAAEASGASPGSAPPEGASGETVERPAPGLARGLWEAPSWLFYVVVVAALLGGLAWLVVGLRARGKGIR